MYDISSLRVNLLIFVCVGQCCLLPSCCCQQGLRYDIFNCNWVATRWQQYSTHIHTSNTENDTKQTIHRTTQKIHRTNKNQEECGPCPVFAGFTLAFALQLRKKHGKTSVKVVIHLSQGSYTSVRIRNMFFLEPKQLSQRCLKCCQRHPAAVQWPHALLYRAFCDFRPSKQATQQVSQYNTPNCLSCGTPLARSVTAPRPPNSGPQQRHL